MAGNNGAQNLAAFAVTEDNSRGREYSEKSHPYRSDSDRDRDRIIHSSAFRRLEGKTQVFTPGLDDNFRTRLTHSIEVSQIGRTIARVLGVNETITEGICLAHDLGHSPFGHCGESVLNGIMADHGGFEHNKQTMRLVELLEKPYTDFRGLNLLYETRLGLSRHRSPYDIPEKDQFPEKNATIEGQIANIADRIAYNCHDLEDGMRGRKLDADKLVALDIYQRAYKGVNASEIKDSFVRNNRIVKFIMDWLVGEAVSESQKRVSEADPKSLEDVLNNASDLVVVSDRADQELQELEKFLLSRLYLTPTMKSMGTRVEALLCELFEKLLADPELMPGYYQKLIPEFGMHRAICDYVSGMTDRYCLRTAGRSLE